MIADQIKMQDKSLGDRGLSEDSFFIVEFTDGSIRTEQGTNWSDMSVREKVEYLGNPKTVFLCNFPVKKINVKHDGLETTIEVPKDCKVYQAVRSTSLLTPGDVTTSKVVARIVGLVKDGKVIEERLLANGASSVTGVK